MQRSVAAGNLGLDRDPRLLHEQWHQPSESVGAGVVERVVLVDVEVIKGRMPFVKIVLFQLLDFLFEIDGFVLIVEVLYLVALLWFPDLTHHLPIDVLIIYEFVWILRVV